MLEFRFNLLLRFEWAKGLIKAIIVAGNWGMISVQVAFTCQKWLRLLITNLTLFQK